MAQEGIKKGAVGSYECWLVGKALWEVRKGGQAVARACSMNECFKMAERLNGGIRAAR